MKRISILMVAAVTLGLASCTAQSPKANLKTEIDSLSYAFGLSRVEGLTSYLVGQVGMDTTYMDEFVKGFLEGKDKYGPKDVAYFEGLRIGQLISRGWVEGLSKEVFQGDSTKQVSRADMLAGFYDGLKEKGVMSKAEAQTYSQKKMEEIMKRATAEKFADNKEAGEKFLAENKGKEGVKTTESGLQYKIIKEGKGAIPAETAKVKVNYKGTLIDGTEFDSSYSRNEPSTFRANQVIKGWTEALTMMPVGSKWELYIPQELAYGDREQQKIKPFSTLIFEVELLGIEK